MLSLVHVYLPPHPNLRRRHLTEEAVREHCVDVLSRVPQDRPMLLCGDFNARTANLAPEGHAPRSSADHVICARGRWLVEQCGLLDLRLLNGSTGHTSGDWTCRR